MKRSSLAAGAAAVLAIAAPAYAHVALAKASPAARAAGAAPAVIELTFSGKVEPKFSGFDLTGPDGAKVALTPQPPAKDGKSLAAKPSKPLVAGAYKVAWHIVSTDGHKMAGAYDFTVR